MSDQQEPRKANYRYLSVLKRYLTRLGSPSQAEFLIVKSCPPISPLSVPEFKKIWIATVQANIGVQIQALGAAWTMISLEATSQYVALVSVVIATPTLMFSLVAGSIADRRDRRGVMLVAQGVILVSSLALTALAYLGKLGAFSLLALCFCIGTGSAFHSPAWQASVTEMVPARALPKAVALNSVGVNLARSSAPAAGGLIVAWYGIAATFALHAISALSLLIVLITWRPAQVNKQNRSRTSVKSGVATCLTSLNVRRIVVRSALFGFAASSVQALLPVISHDMMKGGSITFGALTASFGAGGVLGAVFIDAFRRRISTEALLRLASLVLATGMLTISLNYSLPMSLIGLALAGIGWVLSLSTFNVSAQLAAVPGYVARTVSLYQMMAFGGFAAGSWFSGIVADHYSLETALQFGAFQLFLTIVIGFVLPVSSTQ